MWVVGRYSRRYFVARLVWNAGLWRVVLTEEAKAAGVACPEDERDTTTLKLTWRERVGW